MRPSREQLLESCEITGNTVLFPKSHSARRHRSSVMLDFRDLSDTGSFQVITLEKPHLKELSY